METRGKFLLFADVAEFGTWLDKASISRKIRLLQVHHTWLPNYSTWKPGKEFDSLASMESGHISRGFDMIGQNLTVFPDGKIAVCRPLDRIPAGIKGANDGGICVENIGNFDAGGDTMTPAQRDAIISLYARMCRRFGLTPSTDSIVYHHWYDLTTGERKNGKGSTKTCPGTAFFGGNTVDAAATNFIPLITAELANLGAPKKPVVETTKHFRVTAESLNVRDAASGSGKVVKALAKGVIVAGFNSKDGWLRIDPKAQLWVSQRFVEAVD